MRTETAAKSQIIKKALIEIKKLKRELSLQRGIDYEPVAVIGMACRFPGGVAGPEEFWQALVEMRDLTGAVPETRWKKYRGQRLEHPYLKKAGFLREDIEAFDHRLFRFSPREAERTDPQQRLLLKVCWEALENAGYAPNRLKGSKTGVYAGATLPDYIQALYLDRKNSSALEPGDVTGSGFSFLSGRVSYFFGWHGPGITVDTACSSSLVAVDQACKGLLAGECDMALAGGVNLMYTPETTALLATLNILSPDCVTRSFDAGANGAVRGEGCGMVVLKRLSAAERDGDHIHAVLRGSGVNHDGLSSGLTAPYGPAQEKLISGVWRRCRLDSPDVGYVEAHGTGTALGDPIEIAALGNIVAGNRSAPLYVGTVKTNIGHLEAAAGVAGLIKAVLAVEKGRIPGQLHFETPSPHIDWEHLPVTVPRETLAWAGGPDRPRIAGVSSFGLSGTNAHVVVQQYPGRPPREGGQVLPYRRGRSRPFKFSSVTPGGLREQLASFAAYLEKNGPGEGVSLADLSYSQNIAKADLRERAVVWAGSSSELRERITRALAGQASPAVSLGSAEKKVVFLFTGQGSQYPAMFEDFYRENRIFRACLDECNQYYIENTGRDLRAVIFSPGSLLRETRYTQPALFAVEYALARVWMEYGVEPAVMTGHSVGEYVAACLAGVFDLADAVKLITARGELMHTLPGHGRMAAVLAGKEAVQGLLRDQRGLTVAATNSPEQTVISGAAGEVDEVCAALQEQGIRTVFLQVSHAFHSPLMEPVLPRFEAVAREVRYAVPTKVLISNVTGQPAGAGIASWEYWSRHILSEVRFYESILAIENPGACVFLEIGPAPVLTPLVESICGAGTDHVASHYPGANTAEQMEKSLFHLYSRGIDVNWRKYYAGSGCKKVAVPNYRFDEKHFGLAEAGGGPLITEPRPAGLSGGLSRSDAGVRPSGPVFAGPEEVKEYIRAGLNRELKTGAGELPDDQNLLLYGLNSIITARLAALWKSELAAPLNPGVFLSRCTIDQWAEIVYAATKNPGPGAAGEQIPFRPEPGERYAPFPLNEVQYAYWAGRNAELAWGGVGCCVSFELDPGELDPARFGQALRSLVRRHEMLRDIISPDGAQRIMPELEPPLTVYRRAAVRDLPAHLERVREEMAAQVLPLGKPMFDVRLTELDGGQWRIHFGIDFLIADALSLFIFWQDLHRLYRGEELPALEVSYRDYLHYTLRRKQGGAYELDRRYWLDRAAGFPAAPEIPVRLPGGKPVQGKFIRRKKLLDRDTWLGFVQAAARRNLTPSAALLSLYAEVLSAWGGGGHFAVMLTVFGREDVHPQINRIIGDFTRLTLVEVRRQNVAAALNAAAVQLQMQADIEHGGYSAIDFVKELNKGDSSRERMYPVVFTSALGMENLNEDAEPEGFLAHMGWSVSSTPQVWLDHQVYHEKEGVALSWDTLDAVFQPGVVDAMFETYVELVTRAAGEVGFWQETLTDLRTASQQHGHGMVNNTAREIKDTLMHGPVRRRAFAGAGQTAVVFDGREYSYGQLLRRADQVSQLLQEQGIKKGDRVALQMGKSFDQIAVVLGIVQAGAAYVPIAREHPAGRTLEILRKSEAAALFADSRLDLREAAVRQFTPPDLDGKEGVWREVGLSPADPAYVIFTSGSTGTPKGVCVEHRAAMNTILDVNSRLGVTPQDRVLGLSALNFDLSVYDIFGLLAAGGALVLPSERERLDPKCWRRLCQEHRVTLWNSVPALMEIYADFILSGNRGPDTGIRHVILSGDWIPLGLFDKLGRALPNAKLTGMGGATEAAIWSNYYDVTGIDPDWQSIPYGYPLANQSFHILDEFGRPCPHWVTGKLHIAGQGLARGYLNEPELTGQAFFHHPGLNQRVYDTGDYGRYMSDGAIEFLGRKDSQLKINGHRVEVGEIQWAFRKCGLADDAVILPVGDRMESKKLIAYVKGDPASFDQGDWKNRLRAYLPGYLIPERIIAVAGFPVTGNGKIDRRKLLEDYSPAAPAAPAGGTGDAPARHPVLQTVREVFKLPALKPDDSFGDLGVSSVDMIRLANQLEVVYSARPSVGEMMGYRSVAELIDYYRQGHTGLREENETPPGTAPGAGQPAPGIGKLTLGQEKEHEALPPAADNNARAMEILLERCRSRNIRLWTDGGRLKFRAPGGAMTPEIQAGLKSNKESLLRYLRETPGKTGGFTSPAGRVFRLTPIQLAYVMGRSPDYELGNTGAHYYSEFECGGIDSARLERAVNEVIGKHEMLRTVIYENGTQEVLEEIPVFRVPVRQIDDPRELEEIRRRWSHHRYELGRWPMFHIRISRLDSNLCRLHFSFDCLIVDGWSAEMLFREIFRAYYGQPVAQPGFTFREYLSLEESWLQEKSYHREAEKYWAERIKNIPPAPELPLKKDFSAIAEPHFRRLQFVLSPEDSRTFNERIKKYRFTPSAVVCTAYMKVLSRWSSRKDITLNLTLFNRLPLDKDVPRMLGDFTNITLISFFHKHGGTFVQETEEIRDQLWKAVEYRTYNGLELLRRLARGAPGRAVMPVVFTSLLFGEFSAGDEEFFPPDLREVYAISQTPQVAIDHQAYERNGSLALIWDFVEEAFEEAVIEGMFAAYRSLIEGLIAEEDWNKVF